MSRQPTVLICDDDKLVRWSLSEYLGRHAFRAVQAENGQDCLEKVEAHVPDIVLLDLRMPVMDGLTCLRKLRAAENDVPVIVLTAYGEVNSAIEATRLGATHYLTKPTDLAEVVETIERTLDEVRVKNQVDELTSDVEATRYHTMFGESPSMLKVFDRLRRLEQIDAPTVVILGESGTGKDLTARAIHARGPRHAFPFMEIDCTAIPETLFESTLFGHERGAFTDARGQHKGLFESAQGGVVFLDEIGEMSLPMQAKLLRALENRRFKRVGGIMDIELNVAVICATNRDLKLEVEAGRFREDLYYRLAVVMVEVPALRKRASDIRLLVQHFVRHYAEAFHREIEGISPEAMDALENYPWPGNVRELRNVVERTVIFQESPVIRPSDLPAEIRTATRTGGPGDVDGDFTLPEEGVCLDEVERSLIGQALARTSGNQSESARLLGLSRAKLRYRMQKHGLT